MKEGVCFRDNFEVQVHCHGPMLRITVVKKIPML